MESKVESQLVDELCVKVIWCQWWQAIDGVEHLQDGEVRLKPQHTILMDHRKRIPFKRMNKLLINSVSSIRNVSYHNAIVDSRNHKRFHIQVRKYYHSIEAISAIRHEPSIVRIANKYLSRANWSNPFTISKLQRVEQIKRQ